MGVTVTNLIQGPGTLYYGARYTGAYSAAAEPSAALINTTPAASGWTDIGGTQDGVNFELNREFSELEVDQVVDVPDRRMTKRDFTIATNIAEPTLENLAVVNNEDPDTNITQESGHDVYEPDDGIDAFRLGYRALLFDGTGKSQLRRRVICRRMASIDPVAFAYKKDGQTVYTAKWGGHYVSTELKPYRIIDATS